MARKSQGTNKSSRGGGKGPNWTPYLIAVGIALGVTALFTHSGGTNENGRTAKASGRTVHQALDEMRRLHLGLSAVSERGSTGIFGKIKAMSDQAKGVLTEAEAATTDAEKLRILEEGLESKATWMLTLQEHAVGLKQEEEADDMPGAQVTSESVTVLSLTNFSNFVASNPRTMVEFYAPWCPHCKKFAPEFAKTGEMFNGRAAFAIVNGEEEKQLSRVYGVGGYPTLKWMVSGRAIDYDGPRTHEHLSKWVEERLQPAYVELDSAADAAAALQAVEDGDGNAKICAGEGEKGSRRYQAFVSAAEHLRGKLVFTWSPMPASGGDGQLRLHSKGLTPFVCGSEQGASPNAGKCEDADEVIAWLEDKLLLDPDLQ